MPDHDGNGRRLLILGGTTEAAALARAMAEHYPHWQVISSLAGRVAHPPSLPGAMRIGGFGGAEGLKAYLVEHIIDAVIDATHPFAATIARHAAQACAEIAVPRLKIMRPPWQSVTGDRWIDVATMAAAAQALPGLGRRALLSIGAGEAAAFAGLDEVFLLLRLITPPRDLLPLADYRLLVARGPFALADEIRLLQDEAIDVVVTKASGGDATAAKLDAARQLGLPVVMIRRPDPPLGVATETVDGALDWLGTLENQFIPPL